MRDREKTRLVREPAARGGALSIGLFSLFLLLSPTFATPHEPTAEEQAVLATTGQVLRREIVSGFPWPRFRVFQVIDAPALDAFAIFADIESQKEYVPGVKESHVIGRPGPGQLLVHFVERMPFPLSDEDLVMANHLVKGVGFYEVRWKLVSGGSAESAEGGARFVSTGSSTLLVYETLIRPKPGVAGFAIVEKIASAHVKEVVQILAKHIEKVRRSDPKTLEEKKKRLFSEMHGSF